MHILGKLVVACKLSSLEQILQDAGYTAMISRLGQKRDWRSVLRFDNGKCAAQTSNGFVWLMDLSDL